MLGKIGTLTVEEARGLARDRLIAVSKGADPSADRHAVRGVMTVGELCDLYLRNADKRIKPSTLAMDRSRIETHIKPLIGRLSVRSLTGADVERMKSQIMPARQRSPAPKQGAAARPPEGWALPRAR